MYGGDTFQKQPINISRGIHGCIKLNGFLCHTGWSIQLRKTFKHGGSHQSPSCMPSMRIKYIHPSTAGGGGRITKGHSSSSNSRLSRVPTSHRFLYQVVSFFFFFRCSQHLWKHTLLTGSLTVATHNNNPINIAGLNESECTAQCCYSENTGRVEQTGCEWETKEENRERGREGRWNNNKVKGGGRREDRWGRGLIVNGWGCESRMTADKYGLYWCSHFSIETTLTRKMQAAGWTNGKLTSGITELIRACCYLYLHRELSGKWQKKTSPWLCWRVYHVQLYRTLAHTVLSNTPQTIRNSSFLPMIWIIICQQKCSFIAKVCRSPFTWNRPWWWTTPSWLCSRERREYSVCSSIFPCLSSWVSPAESDRSSSVRICHNHTTNTHDQSKHKRSWDRSSYRIRQRKESFNRLVWN